jgi:hypothetical protein
MIFTTGTSASQPGHVWQTPGTSQSQFRAMFDHEPKLTRQVCALSERTIHQCSLARAS